MKLRACLCDPALRQRIRRSWWMRLLLPMRRLYFCPSCRATMLIGARRAPVLPRSAARQP